MNRNEPENEKLNLLENVEEMQTAFRQLRRGLIQPSPFAKTRIMAMYDEELREKSAPPPQLTFFWKLLSGILAGCLTFGVGWVVLAPKKYDGVVDRAMVVRLKAEDSAIANVAHVQVELPSGVHFSSDEYPELANEGVLTFPKSVFAGNASLPIVVKSADSGVKKIRVRYLDAAQREVESKIIRIQFRDSKSGDPSI